MLSDTVRSQAKIPTNVHVQHAPIEVLTRSCFAFFIPLFFQCFLLSCAFPTCDAVFLIDCTDYMQQSTLKRLLVQGLERRQGVLGMCVRNERETFRLFCHRVNWNMYLGWDRQNRFLGANMTSGRFSQNLLSLISQHNQHSPKGLMSLC